MWLASSEDLKITFLHDGTILSSATGDEKLISGAGLDLKS